MPVGRSSSPTHRSGSLAEDTACQYLQQKGLNIVAKNWHVSGVGEIDLVMLDAMLHTSVLVFVEVRKRQSSAYGGAAGSITAAKRRKIIDTAQYFLVEHPQYEDYDCRFDVVAIESQDVYWYPAAFMSEG